MSAPAEQAVAPRRTHGRGRPLTRWAFAVVVVLSLVVLFSPGSDVPTGLPINDKVVHGTLFAALAFTGWWAALRVRLLAFGLAAYAVASVRSSTSKSRCSIICCSPGVLGQTGRT